MALRRINTATATATATATVTVTADDVSCPRHRYPTRWKLRRSQGLKTEDKAKDRVFVPCKRKKDERFTFYLPREIIFNILLLIPAKVLHKVVRYVCKQWFDIVSDPMFVGMHRQMSSSGFLIQNPLKRSKIYYMQADTARLKVTKFKIPLHAVIEGSFNGLLLLHDMTNPEIYHVVNPVAKKKFSLPPLTGLRDIYSKAGFGLDSSGRCKVVHAYAGACSDEVQLKMRIFTVNIDTSWRFINLQGISLDTREKKALLKSWSWFIAGFIYWHEMPYKKGIALDVDTETIYQFTFPADLTRCDSFSIRFLITETCLGVVRTEGEVWRFWKLTDVKTSEWTEVAGINIRPVLNRVDKMFYPRVMFFVCPVRLINGDFWFYRCIDEDYLIVRYNLVSDNFSFFRMRTLCPDIPIYPHVRTLLSPTNCKPEIVCNSKHYYNN